MNNNGTPRTSLNWQTDPRWSGIERCYSEADVRRLQGSVVPEHTLARRGAEKLWELLHTEDFVPTLGALTGNQAVQQVRAGLKAIYLSGWQVAADANLAGQMYPDQSLYPANSVPAVVKRINQALHALPAGSAVTVDATRTRHIDHDVVELLHEFGEHARARGIALRLVGVPGPTARADSH